jgi:hypothetical protein
MRLALLLIAALASSCWATAYGRNKVQTDNPDWWELSTSRYRIYYQVGAEAAADTLARIADRELEALSDEFGYLPDSPVPIVLYTSPGRFSQTDITTEELPEAVGGLTEYFKGRVVVPFSGNWSEFRHVVDHELNHAFVFDMLYRRSLETIILSNTPLWTIEGLAEYTSAGWDPASEAEFRDMVIGGQTVSIQELSNRGDYLVYREGQAIYQFMNERYGEDRFRDFVRNLAGRDGLDGAIEAAFDMPIGQFDEKFQEWSRETYWAQLADRESPSDVGTPLLRDGKLVCQLGSVVSRDADRIAGVEDWHGGYAVVVRSTVTGRVVRRCMNSGGISDIDISPLYRVCSFSPGGDSLAVAWHGTGCDRLSICGPEGTTDLPIQFDLIRDPAWSPDGDSIAFVALQNVRSDIYCYVLSTGSLVRLTDTAGGERDLSWGGAGLLASAETDAGWVAILLRGSDTREITSGRDLRYPLMTDSGLVYLDYSDGAQDLFLLENSGDLRRLTSLYRSIDSPSWADSAQVLTFQSNTWGGCSIFQTYELLTRPGLPDSVPPRVVNALVPGAGAPPADSLHEARSFRISPYSPGLSTDYVTALADYDSYMGLSGYTRFVFSDVLAHQRLYVDGDFSGSVTDADAAIYYWWLPERIDYGAMAYRQSNRYLFRFSDGHEEGVRDVDVGAAGGASLPFSPSTRIEAGIGYRHLTRTGYWNSDADFSADVLSTSLGLVVDTALWDWVGPRVGSRLSLQCEYAPGWEGLSGHNTVSTDLRHYVWISRNVSLALRAAGACSWGESPETFFVGGAVPHRELLGEADGIEDLLGFYGNYGDMLRGSPYSRFSGRNYGVATAELRVPFVRTLALDAPIPITLSYVRGALFADAGTAFDDPSSFKGADTSDGGYRLDDVGLGIGFGFRANLGILLLREDTAWATDLGGISRKPRHYITLGASF